MKRAYVALGSNLDNPRQQLSQALESLATLADCSGLTRSGFYRSAAVGPGEQPDYVNAVAQIDTVMTPIQLLHALQALETAQGRTRDIRWGPRTLDLDLLLHGDTSLDTEELQLPHPAMKSRNFVLYPLWELAPQLTLPCGTSLESLLAQCPRGHLEQISTGEEHGDTV